MANYEQIPIFYNSTNIKVRLNQQHPQGTSCFKMHWHNRIEFIRMLSGEITVEFGDKSFFASSGDLIVIPPHQMHEGFAKTDALYNVIMFDIPMFYNSTHASKYVLERIYDGNLDFDVVTSNAVILSIIDEITYVRKDFKNQNAEIKNVYLMSLVYNLIFQLCDNGIFSLNENRTSDKMRKIISYIEENYEYDLPISEISKQFGYTPTYFSQYFKDNFGITPHEYLKIYRLEKARKLLKETDKSVKEVAALCGFSDSNYFTRCFKKHFHYTPTFYVKNNDKNIADKT